MTHNLGGPRGGNCRAYSFTVIPQKPIGIRVRDRQDLGIMPWADLIDMVEQAGGTRPAFDLFDMPANPDGTFTRIRAVREGMVP